MELQGEIIARGRKYIFPGKDCGSSMIGQQESLAASLRTIRSDPLRVQITTPHYREHPGHTTEMLGELVLKSAIAHYGYRKIRREVGDTLPQEQHGRDGTHVCPTQTLRNLS